MDRSVEYDVAQRRVAERDRRRTLFYIWLAILVVLILVSVASSLTFACIGPLAIPVGLVAAIQGIRVYYDSPRRVFSKDRIAEELTWLYGEDWANTTSTEEYTFAEDRIRKRRMGRWMFVIHLVLFLPVNGLILYIMSRVMPYYQPGAIWLYAVPTLIWAAFLAWHARQAFPTAETLARRERQAGEAVELELEALGAEKQKRGEKPKRSTRLVLSDDGELVEVPEQEAGSQQSNG